MRSMSRNMKIVLLMILIIISMGINSYAGYTTVKDEILFVKSGMRIGVAEFAGSDILKYVVIEEGFTKIDDEAFENCKNLLQVTLPRSMTSISQYAFWNSDKVTLRGYTGSYAEK